MPKKILLSQISTKPGEPITKEITAKTRKWVERIIELQAALYAEKKQALLVILQGMDASGKDGAVRNVFSCCNPSWLQVHSFKKPSEEEAAHDFLWRAHKVCPAKGMIHVFVRSYYEDVVTDSVHNTISKREARERMEFINEFEKLLERQNNTRVLKFYLHTSQKEQKKHLQERIDDPSKQWKHNPDDWKEAELWDRYMQWYGYIINHCTVPWHIVPVDERPYRDYLIAKSVCENLEDMNPRFPKLKTPSKNLAGSISYA